MKARLIMNTVAIRDDGCFTVLLWDGQPIAVGVERTFAPGEAKHGKRVVIPAGEHLCKRTKYHAGGYETFEIMILGHTRVLFHKGNTEDDSLGCVAVGESFETLKGKTAVLDSKGGFEDLMKSAEGLDEFYVEVINR